ncbi:MAG TPA: hypothetical protein VN028_06875 [Rhodocyclaceae bacterium]|nr:hypothetical protein [Rhodocyclaceae bacterium]
MIEAIVACALVLVPLFLAIPIIAKYQDIRSQVVQGARYAAWERTVWFGGDAAVEMGFGSFTNKWDANEKSDTAIRTEIGKRILSKNGGKFASADKSSSGSLSGDPMWRDRQGNTLLQNYSDVSGSYANDDAPGLINAVLGPVMEVTSVVSDFTVDTHAQYTANVGLAVREVAFNTDPLAVTPGHGNALKQGYTGDFLATSKKMTFSEKNVIVANSWSANGPGSLDQLNDADTKDHITVYRQIRGLTPTSLLKPSGGAFKVVLDVMQAVALVFFPELSTLDLGRIEVDKVPADRLQ